MKKLMLVLSFLFLGACSGRSHYIAMAQHHMAVGNQNYYLRKAGVFDSQASNRQGCSQSFGEELGGFTISCG